MTFAADQITYVADWTQAPRSNQDSHWWRVDLGHGRKPGWLHAAASLPRPSGDWIAAKLNRLERQAGWSSLETAMQAPGGLELEVPPPQDG
jgi:hypothetical protein